MKILIIGLGSIARKHINILKEISSEFKFYALRSSKLSANWRDVTNLYTWEEVKSNHYYFSIISCPSSLHLKFIQKLSNLEIPLMVEKPLFVSKNQLNTFIESNIKPPMLYVAFNMRFHPLIIFIKQYLLELKPKILEVNSYCGSYLPDWRQINHQKTYSSFKNLGGGVHLDLMHEPDYLIHLFGMPFKVNKSYRRVSDITKDSYDYSNITFGYKDFSAQIILNYYRRDKKRVLEIITSNSTLEIDFKAGRIVDLVNKCLIFELKGDLMMESYKNQMNYWLEAVEKNHVSINDYIEANEILEKIL